MLRLIQIGNSKGIRIPKPLIQQAQLDDVELKLLIVEDGLLIKPIRRSPRQGWKAEIEAAIARDDAAVDVEWLDAPLNSDEGWEW